MTTKTKKPIAPKTAPPPVASKGMTLKTPPDPLGRGSDQVMADLAATGVVGNARTMVIYGEPTYGELSLTDCAMTLAETAGKVDGGDLSSLVKILSSQAAALNSIFVELSRRSALNMGQYPDAFERYMRMALRAQGQCRATLETLAAIKNPPLVYARQANINNGGQQQVNNGGPAQPPASAPAAKSESRPNGLLEASSGTWLDAGATSAAGRGDPEMAPVGAVHRSEDKRGQS